MTETEVQEGQGGIKQLSQNVLTAENETFQPVLGTCMAFANTLSCYAAYF